MRGMTGGLVGLECYILNLSFGTSYPCDESRVLETQTCYLVTIYDMQCVLLLEGLNDATFITNGCKNKLELKPCIRSCHLLIYEYILM